MKRTWAENSSTINGLWPQCQWTDEEIDLWHADLSGLDQDLLFEAVRNVKRTRDTLYPQLAWVLEAYRALATARRAGERASAYRQPAYSGERLQIDAAESRRIADEIGRAIEAAGPGDVDAILERLHASVDRMEATVAARLGWRAAALRRSGPPTGPTLAMDTRPADAGEEEEIERRREAALRLLFRAKEND